MNLIGKHPTLKLLILLFLISIEIESAERKPNVIIIFTDDQGSLDASCYGTKDIKTPHIDRIAKNGIRLSQFYAAAPVCSPSRAGLLTGRYPPRAGVPGNVGLTSEGMPSSQITIAEMLKEAGYATAHIGKWHLGNYKETVPNGQGFDYSFGHHVGCIDNYSHFFYWAGPNKHDLFRNNKEVFEDGKYFPDLMVREAKTFINKNKEKPLFIYFASNGPHYPYQGDIKWLKQYKDLPYPRNLYNAFMSSIDERIGQLYDHVKDAGLLEDTIFIFQSDHGHSTEQRAHYGGGYAGQYRGAKFSLLEGGIRVPAIISYPAKLAKGEERKQFTTSCDWFPTIADLCGIKQPKHKIDGKSLLPVLHSADAKTQHEHYIWEFGRGNWVVREGDYKLHKNIKDTSNGHRHTNKQGVFLFDLSKDPYEKNNIAKQNPKIIERLKGYYQSYRKEL